MKLRSKLLWALLPLLIAVGVGGWVASYATTQIAHSAHAILTDNYRSVLAAQRMKEAIERMDSGAMFVIIGRREAGIDQARMHRQRFEEELVAEEHNITESGEKGAAETLRKQWETYKANYDAFLSASPQADLVQIYYDQLYPLFVVIKDKADAVLDLNQDAMMRKSDAADENAANLRVTIMLFVAAACSMALSLSTFGIARLLRPLGIVAQTTRRLAKGDMQARAQVEGHDEVAELAMELNAMATQLEIYQRSSLGELIEAQQAAQSAVDSLPDPVLVYSTTGRLLHVNRAAHALMLPDPSGVLTFTDGRLKQVVQRVREHVEQGSGAWIPPGLQEAVRVDGAPLCSHYLPHAMPLYGANNEIAGTTVALQDVTRLVRFDELKDDFVATVAHELRTPLTSLQMALHLCAEETVGPLNEKQAEMLFAAREDTARLQATVDELLDLSRIQGGRIQLDLRRTAATDIVTNALAAQRTNADMHGVVLRSDITLGTPDAPMDPERLQLVIDNMLSNAIRYTPRDGEVVVRSSHSDHGLRFEVCDAGPGVPETYRAAVFERYFQVPDAPAGRAGLGLFIAREIVLAHGGKVGVSANTPRGSIFWFEIPSDRPQASE